MCGIYCRENRHWSEGLKSFETLLSMRHRGPDEAQIISHNHMDMGFVRLAIIDRDAPEATQPFQDAWGGLTLFNGEIYNYRALDSAAKSEVALVADMMQSGADLRQYLEGDYAIVRYEGSNNRMTLYRDRFGICPLYYQLKPFVAVSSEARRLARPREVPAHGRVVIDVAKRSAKVDVFPLYGATNDGDHPVSAVADMLMHAVLSRFVHSEVPVALALSGGLDSSLIAVALSKLGTPAAEYICTSFSGRSDDAFYAWKIANSLALPLREVRIDPKSAEVLQDAPRVIEHLDQPRAKITPLCYRTALRSYYVAKYARSRVILCGDGPDELLGGYPSHPAMLDRFEHPSAAWRINWKRLDSLRSMQHFNNDRTNKMGMAHSKEFRSPFLSSTLSQVLLARRWQEGKQLLRDVAQYLGMAPDVYNRAKKYSADEEAVSTIPVA